MSEYQKNHPRHIVFNGHMEGGIEDLSEDKEEYLFCDYIGNCSKACFQGTDKYRLCQVRKFKDKYKNVEYSGIGTMSVEDVKRFR